MTRRFTRKRLRLLTDTPTGIGGGGNDGVQRLTQTLHQTDNQPLAGAARRETAPDSNFITVTVPAGCTVDLRYVVDTPVQTLHQTDAQPLAFTHLPAAPAGNAITVGNPSGNPVDLRYAS